MPRRLYNHNKTQSTNGHQTFRELMSDGSFSLFVVPMFVVAVGLGIDICVKITYVLPGLNNPQKNTEINFFFNYGFVSDTFILVLKSYVAFFFNGKRTPGLPDRPQLPPLMGTHNVGIIMGGRPFDACTCQTCL